MLFDGEEDSGLQDGGAATAAALVFLPTDVANYVEDDCTEAEAEVASSCQKKFDQHKSVEFVKLVCVIITHIYSMLDNVIVYYRLSSY